MFSFVIPLPVSLPLLCSFRAKPEKKLPSQHEHCHKFEKINVPQGSPLDFWDSMAFWTKNLT